MFHQKSWRYCACQNWDLSEMLYFNLINWQYLTNNKRITITEAGIHVWGTTMKTSRIQRFIHSINMMQLLYNGPCLLGPTFRMELMHVQLNCAECIISTWPHGQGVLPSACVTCIWVTFLLYGMMLACSQKIYHSYTTDVAVLLYSKIVNDFYRM